MGRVREEEKVKMLVGVDFGDRLRVNEFEESEWKHTTAAKVVFVVVVVC